MLLGRGRERVLAVTDHDGCPGLDAGDHDIGGSEQPTVDAQCTDAQCTDHERTQHELTRDEHA